VAQDGWLARVDRWEPATAFGAGMAGAAGLTAVLVEGAGNPGLIGVAGVVVGAAALWRSGGAVEAPQAARLGGGATEGEAAPAWWESLLVPGLAVDRAEVERALPNRGRGLGPDAVLIPGMVFWMGSPEGEEGRFGDESPRHRVRVSPLLVGRTTVTKRQWREVMDAERECPGGDEHPVTNVTWFDAVAFCNALSALDGLSAAYDAERRWLPASDGWRLPTEAEWEGACRAGTETAFWWGEAFDERRAWSNRRANPVGDGEKVNPWGLADMSGNVLEWCTDGQRTFAVDVDNDVDNADPVGPEVGRLAVLRGGSSWNGPRGLRSAGRFRFVPESSDGSGGFRCVRGSRRQSPVEG
jgi:formylglycine-generating enzyme required for sulfatase activity